MVYVSLVSFVPSHFLLVPFLYNLASAGSCRWHTARSIVFVCIYQPGLILWESGWNGNALRNALSFA